MLLARRVQTTQRNNRLGNNVIVDESGGVGGGSLGCHLGVEGGRVAGRGDDAKHYQEREVRRALDAVNAS